MSVLPLVSDEVPGEFNFEMIAKASARLSGVARRTPAMTSTTLNGLVGANAVLKCENQQLVGAFKFRGAFNALASLAERSSDRPGVIAYSSGNHAQAMALSSSMLGMRCVIVMPANAPNAKLNATRGYLGEWGEVVTYDPATEVREEIGARLSEERGLVIVPPYDHPEVIAGQGTVALELIEQIRLGELGATGFGGEGMESLDYLFVCCGGGGLLSGSAVAAKAMCSGCTVIGVEPSLGDDATRSYYSGELQTVTNPPTIADGARTPFLGRWTFPLVRNHADGMMTVSEAQIAWAMRFAFERMKMVVEPSGALALAGMISASRNGALGDGSVVDLDGARVGVVVSGGNVDVAALSGMFALAGTSWPE